MKASALLGEAELVELLLIFLQLSLGGAFLSTRMKYEEGGGRLEAAQHGCDNHDSATLFRVGRN